ncbi:MAG: MBL fold metallo-hydrolase [Opitutales bacterium]
MKKLFFIFELFILQFCFASDWEKLFFSDDESIFMEIEDTDKGEEDNINNFVMPVYPLQCNNDLVFYFFNTGQGNCTLVKQGDKALLIDCGGSSAIAFDKTFTKCLGEALIECVIITHPHADHCNFLQKISQEHFSEEACLIIGGPSEWEADEKGKKIKKDINVFVNAFGNIFKNKCYISDDGIVYKVGSPLCFCIPKLENFLKYLFKGVEFNFLRFGNELFDKSDLNSYSLVFSITYKNNSILFTGDSTGDAFDRFLSKKRKKVFQKYLVQRNKKIIKNINIFVMPHHGTDTESSWYWTVRINKINHFNLVGAIVCVHPATSPYGHARRWVRDLRFPPYARMPKGNRFIGYNIKGKKGRGANTYDRFIKETKNRLYETGLFTYGIVLVFSESGKIHILNSPNDTNLTHLPKNGEEKDDMGSEPQYPIVSVGQNHETFDVPNDGNCGVWAIMANLNDIHFKEATNSMGYRIATATEKQYEAMNVLRQEVAAQIEEETQQKSRIKGDSTFRRQNTEETINLDYWLQLEDFGIFAKYFNRPIVIQIGMGQAIRYEADGSISGFAPFDQLLADDSILIYYDGQTHYQAIKRKE